MKANKLKMDYQIKLEEDIGTTEGRKIIERTLSDFVIPLGKKVTFYINCPGVSDLFIVTRDEVRKCTSREWTKYFRKVLNKKVYNK